jgi:coenzyme F420-reducing hydrogenase delta subunit/ferredoxin
VSETNGFEPKIVAFVCNWCTYLGADLAGTSRLEYPPNVRILRLPCTGRIDTNLVVKALEVGADAVLVSGCHPGDCHYTAGNYHARRRWILFRELLDAIGFDLRRLHFTWISAAEGKKFQQTITEITEQTRALGPYRPYETAPRRASFPAPAAPPRQISADTIAQVREKAQQLLASGEVNVVIGYGANGPVFITKAEDTGKLEWNERSTANLTVYLKRKEVRALGKAAIMVKGPGERALVVLEQESQIRREDLHVISMEPPAGAPPASRFAALDALLAKPPGERLAFWTAEFDRCLKCYACRQVCPLCYCEVCIADKNRPQAIDTSADRQGGFAWHIARAMHLAGRCVGCGECTGACPAGIDLRLLNLALARAAETQFGYRAGADPAVEPLIGRYSVEDKEAFIG